MEISRSSQTRREPLKEATMRKIRWSAFARAEVVGVAGFVAGLAMLIGVAVYKPAQADAQAVTPVTTANKAAYPADWHPQATLLAHGVGLYCWLVTSPHPNSWACQPHPDAWGDAPPAGWHRLADDIYVHEDGDAVLLAPVSP